jgi:hypothetical protein
MTEMAITSVQRSATTRSLGKAVEAFLAWWRAGLADCCPAPVRRFLGPRRLYISLDDGGLGYAMQPTKAAIGGRRTPLDTPKAKRIARQLAKSRPVVLCLPDALWLQQYFHLPQGQATPITTLITHGLESLSPFNATEVHVAGAAQLHNSRTIDIRYAMKSKVDPLLQSLAELRLHVDAIWLGDPSHAIDLHTRKSRKQRLMKRLSTAFFASALMLALATLLGIYQHGAAERDQMANRIAEIEQQLRKSESAMEASIGAVDTSRRSAETFAQKPVFSPLLAVIAGKLGDKMRLDALDLSDEGLRATLLIRSPQDPAPLLTGDHFLPALAIQAIQPNGDASYSATVSVPYGALRSLTVSP